MGAAVLPRFSLYTKAWANGDRLGCSLMELSRTPEEYILHCLSLGVLSFHIGSPRALAGSQKVILRA